MLEKLLEYQKLDGKMLALKRDLEKNPAKQNLNKVVVLVKDSQNKLLELETKAKAAIQDYEKYKAEYEGKYFILVNKWFASTKTCSHCGHKNDDITLKTKEWICPECGTYHMRDHNAAINIKREGYRMLLA